MAVALVVLLTATIASSACISNSIGPQKMVLATTTSTENTGLLKVLLPPFEKKFNVRVDVIAVGTGKALKLGKNGDVDVDGMQVRQQAERRSGLQNLRRGV